MRQKILALGELTAELDRRRAGLVIGLCHGVFDLLHPGHIRHFEEARRQCDLLVVTVTPDAHVNKGPERPVFGGNLRAESIAALTAVDYVALTEWPTAVETIHLLRPDRYFKGDEYTDAERDLTGKIVDETDAVRSQGGEVVFTHDISFSSSRLLNTFFSPFDDCAREYVHGLSKRYGAEYMTGLLSGATALRVLAVGETIVDEYCYCETLGKSGKEPILAAKWMGEDRFCGGVQAVANDLASFCDEVESLSMLGEVDSHEQFIRESLRENITPHFVSLASAPTIVKRRFVETYPFQKLFEVYVIADEEVWSTGAAELSAKLESLVANFDVVVVADYGHGMLDKKGVELLATSGKFLAVNTQINAGNHGFNTISKYPRADFVCISERELRMDARSRRRPLEDLVLEASARLCCPRMIITSGKQGSLCYAESEGFFRVPALTNSVVDRVGAGDSLLAVASLCVALGAPIEVAGFIGNAVGAQAVGTVCNERPIDRTALLKHMAALLK